MKFDIKIYLNIKLDEKLLSIVGWKSTCRRTTKAQKVGRYYVLSHPKLKEKIFSLTVYYKISLELTKQRTKFNQLIFFILIACTTIWVCLKVSFYLYLSHQSTWTKKSKSRYFVFPWVLICTVDYYFT